MVRESRMPTLSYRWYAPVGFSASTPSTTVVCPRSRKAAKACSNSARPRPRPRHGLALVDLGDGALHVDVAELVQLAGTHHARHALAVPGHEPQIEVELGV